MMRRMAIALLVLAGALVALVVALRWIEPRLLYFPARALDATPAVIGLPYEDVRLRADDGVELHGWYVPAAREPAPAVLFLHGNAGNISHRIEKIAILHDAGAAILIVDYRGYGRSEGRPTEAGLYLDARAALAHLLEARGTPAPRVVLHGESLGTAVAVDVAAEHAVGGVILEAAFTSVPRAAAELYRGLPVSRIVRSRFDALAKIGRVHAPLLILHSRSDEFFGWHHAEALLAAAPDPRKQLVELEGGHNDAFVVSEPVYRNALREFLATLPAVPSAR
jgi:fermentation-respiration switch protein FrsA (DUF1100 family)